MSLAYRSRVDSAAVAVLLLGPAPALVLAVALPGIGWGIGLLLGVIALAMVGLPLWLLVSTRYCLDTQHLAVRCGPFSWDIPLGQIRRVSRTRDPHSAPALSLRRLRVDYGEGRSLLISPRDEAVFLAQLRSLLPGVDLPPAGRDLKRS